MPIDLAATGLRSLSECSTAPFIGRIREKPDHPESERGRELLLLRGKVERLPPGFRGYLLTDPVENSAGVRDVYVLAPAHRYLAEGDVVRVHPSKGSLAALYRRRSPSNTMLVTERCDNYCLMCSQPPRKQDDAWLVDELMEVIPLMSPETHEIGITGGEPGLLGGRLVELIRQLKTCLPRTAVHILSNGRAFAKGDAARALAHVHHPDLMVGVPLYSNLPEEHDYVVQARGAFDETVRGILNLKRVRVRVEIRVVIHAQTYELLPELAYFIARNLLFVDHVALMGLELMGFAKTNLGALWVDPLDYQVPLAAAVRTLHRAGLNTSIYNHQLCTLPEALHPFARKSISDWKNDYVDDCRECLKRSECGGFFSSGTTKRSRGILPYRG